MTQSLKQLLEEQQVDSDAVQQAVRYYLAELTDDLTPDEMQHQLINTIGSSDAVNTALRQLKQDPLLLENVSLLLLSSVWEETSEQERVERVLKDAKGKLPVIEVGIIAIVAMYGMYLIATGGVKKRIRTTTRKPDGTLEEKETKEIVGPEGPLSLITKLFAGLGKIGS
jgi:hypothetical protein